MPAEDLTGWMAVAERLNPLSYLLEAMRAALLPGEAVGSAGAGVGVAVALVGLGLLAVRAALARGTIEAAR